VPPPLLERFRDGQYPAHRKNGQPDSIAFAPDRSEFEGIDAGVVHALSIDRRKNAKPYHGQSRKTRAVHRRAEREQQQRDDDENAWSAREMARGVAESEPITAITAHFGDSKSLLERIESEMWTDAPPF
jgi:hypothetical protein